jgi:hypothetical protein
MLPDEVRGDRQKNAGTRAGHLHIIDYGYTLISITSVTQTAPMPPYVLTLLVDDDRRETEAKG